MTLLLFYFLLAVGVSYLCSLLEAALLSITPTYIAAQQEAGKRYARVLRRLKEHIDEPLAAILTLNTIAHTMGAAGVGAQAEVLWGSHAMTIASVVLTLVILVVSEIIPKTLGALYWRSLAPWVARILPPLIRLLYPFVRLSEFITRKLSEHREQTLISREELLALAELGLQEGVLAEEESRILKNLELLHQLRVRDIMTPRIVLFAVPEQMTVGEFVRRYPDVPFSRIPVYGAHLDDITGYVLKTDILLKAAQDELHIPLRELRRPILMVPADMPVFDLFERMLNQREHLALVIDEYGGTEGVVTMEDIIETLLGLEIVDESDTVQDMQALARKLWQERAERMGLLRWNQKQSS